MLNKANQQKEKSPREGTRVIVPNHTYKKEAYICHYYLNAYSLNNVSS